MIASRALWVTRIAVVGRSCHTSSNSLLKPIGGALVERHERLVEQQQVRLGGEGAGQRHAARQAERQFLRIARQHVGDADGLGEVLEVGLGEAREPPPARYSA